MNATTYQNITPREASPGSTSKLFYFYRIRTGTQPTRFLPGDGAKLHFANRDTDTLTLPGMPAGFLAAGDTVKAYYKGTCVFIGEVETIVEINGRGDDATNTVTCAGPWAKMSRMIYRQYWTQSGNPALSSRLILNSTRLGSPQNLNSELCEIVDYARAACGLDYRASGDISVSSQQLPFDECRDITVADAIKRELRFFPDAICKFDYSSEPPTIIIKRSVQGYTNPRYYPANAKKTAVQRVRNAHPIDGVDLEIETTGTVNGVEYRNITHQTAGNTATDNPNCLYATLQIRGASSNATIESAKIVTEARPQSLNDKNWWRARHPRLAKYSANEIEITQGKQTMANGDDPYDYAYITTATAGELDAVGKAHVISEFSCVAKITTSDDVEENIWLYMYYLTTTDAGRTYTWVADSTAETSESVPSGLAAAILASRSGALQAERFTMRLGDSFPQLGDLLTEDGQNLILQSFDVDCGALTVDLNFGVPDHLSPEDMASLLSGFRNKRTTVSSTLRKTGKVADTGKNVELGVIKPISSTEFTPGSKTKTTIKSIALSPTTGAIELDSAAVPQGKTIAVKTLTLLGAGTNGADKQIKILAAEDMTIDPDGGSLEVASGTTVVTGISWNPTTYSLDVTTAPLAVDANGKLCVDSLHATTTPIGTVSHSSLHAS